jgi:hypothetical protein
MCCDKAHGQAPLGAAGICRVRKVEVPATLCRAGCHDEVRRRGGSENLPDGEPRGERHGQQEKATEKDHRDSDL